MDNSLIPQHKRLALGETLEDTKVESIEGWPGGRCKDEGEPKMARGVGRGPDAKKSGMPSGDPQRAPFFDSKGVDAPGMVKVSEHTRRSPGTQAFD